MNDLDQPFTPESVQELHDHIDNAFQRDRTLSEEMLKLYWNQKAVTLPDTANLGRAIRYQPEKVTTQEAMRIIDLLVSLYIKPLPVSLVHRDEGSGRSEDRERTEQALELTRRRVDHQERVRLARIRGQLLCGRGATLGPMAGGEHWWNYPYQDPDEPRDDWKERKADWIKSAPGLPFVYIELPPESTFPASLGSQNELVGTKLAVTYWDLRSIFSEEELAGALPAKPQKPDQPFTLFMASNRRWLTYSLMDLNAAGVTAAAARFVGVGGKYSAELRQIRHDMGRSVIRLPAGVTRSRWPGGEGYYWLPALFPVAELIKAADKATSYVATGAKENALPTLVAKMRSLWIEGEGTGQGRQSRLQHDVIHIDPGDPQQNRAEESIGALHKPQFGREMQEFLVWLHGRIDRISGTGAMLEGLLAADTAWATKTALQYALRKHSELTSAIAEADRDELEGYLMAAEAYGEPLLLRKGDKDGGALELKPDDRSRWMADLESDYAPDVPVNELAMLQAGIEAMVAVQTHKLPLGLDTIMERYGISDQPLEEWRKSVGWDARTSPFVRERLLRKRLDEADVEVDAEDEGMTIDQLEREYQGMSPEQQQRAGPAKRTLVSRAMAGAQRAGTPFETAIPEPEGLEPQI